MLQKARVRYLEERYGQAQNGIAAAASRLWFAQLAWQQQRDVSAPGRWHVDFQE